MFKCNYLDNLKDKTFQKLMISDQKHKCEKGPQVRYKRLRRQKS